MLPTFCMEWCWVQVVNAVVTRSMKQVVLVWQMSVLRGAQDVMNSFGTTCESQVQHINQDWGRTHVGPCQ